MTRLLGRAFPRTLLALPFAAAVALAVPGCSQGPEEISQQSSSNLDQNQRRWVMTQIRDSARGAGLGNAYLLAGIANHETHLANCFRDYEGTACVGPNSPECGGAILAGGGDGACGDQQGGLGLFQFDAGTYWDTLNTYGNDVLTIGGATRHAVDYAIKMVRDSPYTTNAETYEKARAWINNFDIRNGRLRDQWIRTVLRMYNGCQEGWDCWYPRYQQYNDGLQEVLNEVGLDFWSSGGNCPGAKGTVGGAIAAKYYAIGGCSSIIGAPITNELTAPDGFGRYNVFERGAIYWTEKTGAFEIHGQIRDKWVDLGWETREGKLGYPLTDEMKTPDGIGRYSAFERGSIYWTEKTGAHEVLLPIRDKYKELGWETGALGYPITGEQDVEEGKRSDFQHGSITWNKTTGKTTVVMEH